MEKLGKIDFKIVKYLGMLILAVSVSFNLTGCKESTKRSGTVSAVSECIEKNSKQGELVSKQLIKSQCIKREQIKRHFVYQENYRSSVKYSGENVLLTGNLLNYHEDFVITEIEVLFQLYDGDGKKYSNSGVQSNLWIEPSLYLDLNVAIPIDEDITIRPSEFCSHKPGTYKNCKTWNVVGFKGINVSLN